MPHLTKINSPFAPLLLVGQLDLLGTALCKLHHEFETMPIVRTVEQEAKNSDDPSIQDSVRPHIKHYNKACRVMIDITGLLRQIRDGLALGNDIGHDPIHESAAYQAEELSAELEKD